MTRGLTFLSHQASRIPAILCAAALAACIASGLCACGHEPEKATPPTEGSEQASSTNQSSNTNDAKEQSSESSGKQTEQAKAETKSTEAKTSFKIAIRNGGGADGLAGAAQEKIVAAGLDASTHEFNLETYAKSLSETTVAYIKADDENAASIRSEADKIIAAIGAGSVANYDEEAAGETMDGYDIFVVIGQDATALLS